MPADKLNFTLIQPDIVWENKEANFRQYEDYISSTREQREVVILPEMFSTGFTMQPREFAETMEGASVQWMKDMAAKYRCILTGSLIIEEDGNYYNRLVWMQPNGQYGIYDKRHLFAYAGEDEHYSRGERRLITSVSGWKVCLMICYDLRFPVWSRNRLPLIPSDGAQTDTHPTADEGLEGAYDVLVYVANWPEKRNLAWTTLLRARAIENQCYVIGVNRVGTDGNGIYYRGNSAVFGPLGEEILHNGNQESACTTTLFKEPLMKIRTDLPFLKDGDKFLLL